MTRINSHLGLLRSACSESATRASLVAIKHSPQHIPRGHRPQSPRSHSTKYPRSTQSHAQVAWHNSSTILGKSALPKSRSFSYSLIPACFSQTDGPWPPAAARQQQQPKSPTRSDTYPHICQLPFIRSTAAAILTF